MGEVEYRVIEETPTFYIGVGKMPKAKLEEYLVINKDYGVVEYNNPILYFVREWTRQMEEALEGKEPGFPPPSGANAGLN
jgi:hypothetical protein